MLNFLFENLIMRLSVKLLFKIGFWMWNHYPSHLFYSPSQILYNLSNLKYQSRVSHKFKISPISQLVTKIKQKSPKLSSSHHQPATSLPSLPPAGGAFCKHQQHLLLLPWLNTHSRARLAPVQPQPRATRVHLCAFTKTNKLFHCASSPAHNNFHSVYMQFQSRPTQRPDSIKIPILNCATICTSASCPH